MSCRSRIRSNRCWSKRSPKKILKIKCDYLSKVANVKQVERLEELTLPHSEGLAAGREERPNVLQTEKLRDGKQLLGHGDPLRTPPILRHAQNITKRSAEPTHFQAAVSPAFGVCAARPLCRARGTQP